MPSLGEDGFVNPLENPEATNAAVEALLANEDGGGDWPQPEPLESDLVELPGGILEEDGKVIKHARVRELTGSDEEALARAAIPLNPFHFLQVLLECGVVSIGDEPKKKTKELLKNLLVGDRDALIMGIRRATYGSELKVTDWTCPECGMDNDLTITLDEIPVVELDSPSDQFFEVDLRNGRKAKLRLANGADQLAVFQNPKLNVKERDTLLLSRVLDAFIEPGGLETSAIGLSTGMAKEMNIQDRSTILQALAEKQPGPRFGEIKFNHDACDKEVTVAVGIGEMFPDL